MATYDKNLDIGQNQSLANNTRIRPQHIRAWASAVPIAGATVWPQNTNYTFPAAAAATTISSSDVNDSSADTGARTVFIRGLNAAYQEVEETAVMNGQAGVTLANQYLRVNELIVLTAGLSTVNEGTVYVGTGAIVAGVPANVINVVAPLTGESTSGFFTVPAGRRLLIEEFAITCSAAAAANSALVNLFAIPFGGARNLKMRLVVGSGSPIMSSSWNPMVFEEKTDVIMSGSTTVGTEEMAHILYGIIYDGA